MKARTLLKFGLIAGLSVAAGPLSAQSVGSSAEPATGTAGVGVNAGLTATQGRMGNPATPDAGVTGNSVGTGTIGDTPTAFGSTTGVAPWSTPILPSMNNAAPSGLASPGSTVTNPAVGTTTGGTVSGGTVPGTALGTSTGLGALSGSSTAAPGYAPLLTPDAADTTASGTVNDPRAATVDDAPAGQVTE